MLKYKHKNNRGKMMKLIDSHSHINLDDFKKDFDDLLKKTEENLEFIINIGYDLKTSKESVNLSKKYDFIYATVGVHPHDAITYNTLVEEELIELSKSPKVLAIGEIGLDYYRDHSPRDVQQEVFRKQLKLAVKLDKPVVIHCRDAYDDTLNILNEFKDVKGIMHSYSGSYEFAKRLMDRFYFSISGPVTFKNAKNVKDMVKAMPIEKLLVETDAPYLTPMPYRGQRNEPSYVEYVASEIAIIKEMDLEDVIRITNENTKKAFRIGK